MESSSLRCLLKIEQLSFVGKSSIKQIKYACLHGSVVSAHGSVVNAQESFTEIKFCNGNHGNQILQLIYIYIYI